MKNLKAGVEIYISNKIDFKTKVIKRDRERQYIILKGVIRQEDITLINIYAPNIGTPKYIRKILEDIKKDVNNNTLIVAEFNTPLSTMDSSSKQSTKTDVVALNNSIDKVGLIYIYM